MFDGHFIRDSCGDYVEEHPKREEILNNYIKQENTRFKQENDRTKAAEILRRKYYQKF